jgi:hypothetical protein
MCNNPSYFFFTSYAIVLFYTPQLIIKEVRILSGLLRLTAKEMQGVDPVTGAVKFYNPYKRANFWGEYQV